MQCVSNEHYLREKQNRLRFRVNSQRGKRNEKRGTRSEEREVRVKHSGVEVWAKMSSDDELPLALLALANGKPKKVQSRQKAKGRNRGDRHDSQVLKAPNKPNKEVQKKPRVTYDRPGQTRPTPPEGDPLRRYYTSLYNQQPNSGLAQRFCAQHGLMPLEVRQGLLSLIAAATLPLSFCDSSTHIFDPGIHSGSGKMGRRTCQGQPI